MVEARIIKIVEETRIISPPDVTYNSEFIAGAMAMKKLIMDTLKEQRTK